MIFDPKAIKFCPKYAFLGTYRPCRFICCPVGWWLWRAGCISQDSYLLYWVIPIQIHTPYCLDLHWPASHCRSIDLNVMMELQHCWLSNTLLFTFQINCKIVSSHAKMELLEPNGKVWYRPEIINTVDLSIFTIYHFIDSTMLIFFCKVNSKNIIVMVSCTEEVDHCKHNMIHHLNHAPEKGKVENHYSTCGRII